MERAEQTQGGFNFRKAEGSSQPTGIPITNNAARNFTNSNTSPQTNFVPLPKSKQEQMMEEAEKKEQ